MLVGVGIFKLMKLLGVLEKVNWRARCGDMIRVSWR